MYIYIIKGYISVVSSMYKCINICIVIHSYTRVKIYYYFIHVPELIFVLDNRCFNSSCQWNVTLIYRAYCHRLWHRWFHHRSYISYLCRSTWGGYKLDFISFHDINENCHRKTWTFLFRGGLHTIMLFKIWTC